MITAFPLAVDFAIKATAILAAARLATWLLRRRSAAARHQVWTAASAAVLLLPLLSLSLPAWRPAATTALAPVLFQITATAPATVATPPTPAAPLTPATAPRTSLRLPGLRTTLLFLWIAGCFVSALPLALAALRLRRQRAIAEPSPYSDLSAGLARDLEIARPVAVLETPEGTMPMTLGILRPAVLLPEDARRWTEQRRRLVLLHELAHVRRADVAAQFLTRTALTLNWWNPLAWTAWSESLKERERAADDLVLSTGARASDYAENLLDIARTFRHAPLDSAAVCMARRPQLEGRLLAILDTHTNHAAPSRAFAALTAAVALAVVAPLAALHAQAPQPAPITKAEVDATIRSAFAQHNSDLVEQPAQAFADKKDFDTARTLLDTGAAIRAGVSGTSSVDYGLGLLKIADLEARRKNTSDATAFYTKALQVLGDRPEAVRAYVYLGIRSLAAKNLDQATAYFESGLALKTPQSGTAAMWLGVVKERQSDPTAAEAMYQNALALQLPISTDAATTMRLYSDFLTRQNRPDEAATLEARRKTLSVTLGQVADRLATYVSGPNSSPVPSNVFRPGTGVSQPSLLTKVEPAYSEDARLAKLQGTVGISLVVSPEGLPTNIQVVSPLGLGLDQSAVDAVSAWTFKPGMKDGNPVPVQARIEVNFKLL